MGNTDDLRYNRKLLKQWKVEHADSSTAKYWTKKWIHKGFCRELQRQIRDSGASVYVESGTCAGWSTLWATLALPDHGITFTADPNNVPKIWEHPILWEEYQRDVIPRIFYSQARFHESMHRVMPLVRGKRKVIFIDGKHTEDAVQKDWSTVRQWLQSGDIVLFDDYKKNRRVRRAVNNILKLPGEPLGRAWRYKYE